MDFKKKALIQARMIGLSIILTLGLIASFACLMLLTAQLTGEYHCSNAGGELIGNSCEIGGELNE